ncbi:MULTISPECIES: tRNA (adenine(22)-N(1))-methyltransferase [unclassified Candidatus Frackibacter]|uniref:tRNA (adenine(22)-N(1))-methyltransferase n=1 Tax=unclassified Candidatus Frackibacter TaxID=2648818 RepID=UPI00079CB6C3|nr:MULTISPECIES: class I SAM-dependent methyltransferase [unclassified Candidatus Frackibacter]KXS41870.1 MAG: tRNA (adenine22-N1)-methyltransferase [Candidatus Frackibacter sp. T328-2]SDC63775.1 tRNA (adenine22-N1)-methyltransferase [Candidatus Frackibacter sp. WG11]SEM78046.1 tRNA (adenine22-N1)-methyltransferase [Candidatus Frackibacter sp. WG12]SFL88074.1 tRNA (adenine22-N1)-methyltransferase [Candidatus Frackibacter sp. WG13]
MQLSKRLLKLISFVDQPCSIADIGTDHAYLPIYLAKNFSCDKLIATDIKQGPYEAAVSNIKKFGLQDKIEVRIGAGLTVLKPKEVKSIVIAGMGGNTIIDILTNEIEVTNSLEKLILQPMNASYNLREWLVTNHWQIKDEGLVREGAKFYEVIAAQPGQEIIDNDFLLEVGPRLREEEPQDYKEFLLSKAEGWQRILNDLPEKEIPELINKRRVLEEKIANIREVIQCL